MYKGVFSNIKNRLFQELVPYKLKHSEIKAFRAGNKANFDTTWEIFNIIGSRNSLKLFFCKFKK